MHKYLIGFLGATALATASAASATESVDFSTPSGTLGTTQDYVTGAGTIHASGFTDANAPTNLYGKNLGTGETGLGLTNDGSGQNEIQADGSNFIQLNLSDLVGVTMVQFFMNSTTAGETWQVYGTDDAGCAGAGSAFCGALVNSGSDELTHTLGGWGQYTYFDFYATGTSNGALSNVLLGGLSLTESVPEPATWAMMLLGFGAIGVAFRRRRRTTVTLPQLA
jgi:PEP-CTERM motif-containing protein